MCVVFFFPFLLLMFSHTSCPVLVQVRDIKSNAVCAEEEGYEIASVGLQQHYCLCYTYVKCFKTEL